jgi:CRISPR/Cas system CSM-associated protein Csm5 (group 7 of RAMP superfamily)|eukprot:scaffold323_cov251-Chaetoceros_neogracile.AAC.1
MDDEEIDNLEFQKAGIIKHIEGIAEAEMNCDQANEEMVAFVKEKELQDGLVSGSGSGWKEKSFAPTVDVNGSPPENARNIPKQSAQEKKCCVIA